MSGFAERGALSASHSALDVLVVGVFFGRWLQVYLITLGNANSIIKAGVVFRKERGGGGREGTHARAILNIAIANPTDLSGPGQAPFGQR